MIGCTYGCDTSGEMSAYLTQADAVGEMVMIAVRKTIPQI